MDCSTPGFPVLCYPLEFAQTHVHWVGDAIHLILCCPLFLLPSSSPSISIFSSELAFHIKWPEYWNFSFSISPFNEYSGLISFRIDQFDLLAFQGTMKAYLLSKPMCFCPTCTEKPGVLQFMGSQRVWHYLANGQQQQMCFYNLKVKSEKVKVLAAQLSLTLVTSWTVACQAPLFMELSR